MKYTLKKDYTNGAGRVIKAGSDVEVHKSDLDRLKSEGYIGSVVFEIPETENTQAKQIKKETRKK